MAVALGWTGYVDTDLKFTEFFAADHTLVVRFMPQYPNAYEGPFVAENGTGTFGIGQGEWLFGGQANWGTKLYLAVGSQFTTFRTTLRAGTWYHLAVAVRTTGTQRTFTVYLDGVQLGQPLTVAAGASGMPQGTLRFGKRTTGQTVNGHNAQYYGFLDDVAVFKRALTAAEIQQLRTDLHLTGKEADLLAGYTFAQGTPPAILARPIALHGAAQTTNTSTGRNNAADAALLPLPTGHRTMHLPFPSEEAWLVVKGIDTDGEHHEGYASFCWDFVLADKPKDSRGEYPNGTGGAPLFAAAGGRVVTAREGEPIGTATPNLLEIEQAPGEVAGYMHLRTGKIIPEINATVQQSQQVALAGGTGLLNCTDCNHLHFTVGDHPDSTPGFVTIPIAFSDYEVRTSPNTWQHVARGIPRAQQVLRNPQPTPDHYNAIWIKGGEHRPAVWDWRRKDFDTQFATLRAQGYQPHALNAFVRPNDQEAYYDAVWVKDSQNRPVLWDYRRADFDAQFTKIQADGYQPHTLTAFVRPGGQEAFYNAIWVKSSEHRPALWDYQRKDFDAQFAKLQAQGYQLHALTTFVRPDGQAYYNAIWVKDSQTRPAVWDWRRADFDTQAAKMQAQGYQLHALSSFVRPGSQEVYYNAIWIKDSQGRLALWDYQRRHFDARFADLSTDGYQLADLNTVAVP